MAAAQRLIVARETERRVEARPDEVFDAAFDGEFEDTNAPVDFGFLADGETVQVYENVGDSGEG